MKRWMALVVILIAVVGCGGEVTPAPTPTSMRLPTSVPPTEVPATATLDFTPVPPTPLPTATLDITPVPPTEMPTLAPTETPLPTATTAPTVAPTGVPAPVLVGAGDIAVCGATGDEATAQLLDRIEGTVFTLGDNTYADGTLQEFLDCYEPSWGRHKARTRPVPGNHDYNTPGAAGYFEYFGAAAGDPNKGYYTYEVGEWLVVVLNSEIATDENSEQAAWLREVLAQNPHTCTVAMIHRPLFSSGPHGLDGSGEKTRPLWDILYANGVEMVLSGHDHNYERFAPQNPQGELDTARGVRQFVVGTGGAVLYPFGESKVNSERRLGGPFGVLKLTLHPTSYDWDFVSISPIGFRDRGTGECF